VEVQPYAFTTRSLFVGHTDHAYLRWQVIDTPGILDRPLEERNTIEMQSITALAHLRCCVLYVVDISEQCGFSIAQQAALFDSIKPLFSNKPLVVAFNKVDARALDAVPPEDAARLRAMAAAAAGSVGGMGAAEAADAPLLTMNAASAVSLQSALGFVYAAAGDVAMAATTAAGMSQLVSPVSSLK
jgi:nucleolar GTP-binding protein